MKDFLHVTNLLRSKCNFNLMRNSRSECPASNNCVCRVSQGFISFLQVEAKTQRMVKAKKWRSTKGWLSLTCGCILVTTGVTERPIIFNICGISDPDVKVLIR